MPEAKLTRTTFLEAARALCAEDGMPPGLWPDDDLPRAPLAGTAARPPGPGTPPVHPAGRAARAWPAAPNMPDPSMTPRA